MTVHLVIKNSTNNAARNNEAAGSNTTSTNRHHIFNNETDINIKNRMLKKDYQAEEEKYHNSYWIFIWIRILILLNPVKKKHIFNKIESIKYLNNVYCIFSLIEN